MLRNSTTCKVYDMETLFIMPETALQKFISNLNTVTAFLYLNLKVIVPHIVEWVFQIEANFHALLIRVAQTKSSI